MNRHVDLTIDLIEKFDVPVPRYTSYPMVPHWSNDFNHLNFFNHLKKVSQTTDDLSLYLHLPFCGRRCFFCACNVLVSSNMRQIDKYIDYVEKELKSDITHLGDNKKVTQFHLGGGTPTHLTPEQLDRLLEMVNAHFKIDHEAERSIEVHPSVTSSEHIDILKDWGFNRLSVGIQDFDPFVQEKINRFQTFEETQKLIEYARQIGFESVNGDLIYGLPYQTSERFQETIDQILLIRPDRLAVYSYAHMPKQIKHQSIFPPESLPDSQKKVQLFLDARVKLLDNDYFQIGFDHFAVEKDDLWISYL
ncbi:MAG: oxygen-independent coproporphyrinogen III oxidase, partial [Candidatus Thorarchaeota archaeon]